MRIVRSLILVFFIFISLQGKSQERTRLYSDNKVNVYFKKFDHQYGYIIDEMSNVYSFSLVKYKIKDDLFIVEEIDTVIVLDSMVYYSKGFGNYQDGISLRYRINEAENTSISDPDLCYIINDSLIIHQEGMVKNDELHRAKIEGFKEPFTLSIDKGVRKIGPFVIEPNTTGSPRNIEIKIVVLVSSFYGENDLAKLMPSHIFFEGKNYKLKATFLE